MFNMALLNSGFNIDQPQDFTGTLQKLINVGFGLDREEPVEEIDVEVDEDEPESEEKPEASSGSNDEEEEIVIDADTMTHTSSRDAGDVEADIHDDL